jgi:hypothetical protein
MQTQIIENNSIPKEGEYYFEKPKDFYLKYCDTFSVGIRPAGRTKTNSLRPGKIVFRVHGYTDEAEKVYEVARAICRDFNDGRMELLSAKRSMKLNHSRDSLHP